MKHFTFFNNGSRTALQIVAFYVMLFTFGVGSVRGADISLYTEGWESHHNSGSNNYTDPKTYGSWTFYFSDAISNANISGSYLACCRVAANSTNSPYIVSTALTESTDHISQVSWKCRGNGNISLTSYYSTDGTNWSVGKSATSLPGSSTTDTWSYTLDVTGTLYLKFVFSVASSTKSNRDGYIDDITVTGSHSGGEEVEEYTVTYNNNSGSGTMTDASSPYASGSTVTTLPNAFTRSGYIFTKWNTQAGGGGTNFAEGATFSISKDTTLYAQWVASSVHDDLSRATTEISNGSGYGDWSEKSASNSGHSVAIYAGNSAGGNDAIQLRSSDNAGIVTTTSGGKAKYVSVVWNANTASGRTIDIYGKNTAYASAADLYGDNKGTKIGSIVCGTSTVLAIASDYKYIGIRSNNNALYLTSVSIEWNPVFTVTYDANGGSVTPSNHTQASAGASITLATPTLTGYNCTGWYTATSGGTKRGNAGASYTPTADETVHAQWSAKTYTNTLDREGGTTGSESVTMTYNSSTLTGFTAPTKSGYAFQGYYSGDDGTGTLVIDKDGVLQKSVTISEVAWTNSSSQWVKDGTVTLYAKWNEILGDFNVAVLSPNGVTITATTSTDNEIGEGENHDATNTSTVTLNYSSLESGLTWGGWRVYKSGDASTTVSVSGTGDGATFTMPAYDVKVTAFVFGDMIAWCDTFYYFTGQNATDAAWDDMDNWENGEVPGIGDDVVLLAPAEINIANAQAKSIVIDQSSTNTGKLTILAGKALVVAGTIKKTTDGETLSATEVDDLEFGSTLAAGTGALVMGEHDGTNQATVQFATKAYKNGNFYVNQYIGTPFNDETDILQNYYNSWIYAITYQDGVPGWNRRVDKGYGLNPFEGYDLMRPETTQSVVLSMEGTLVSSDDVTLTSSSSPVKLTYNGSSNTENVLANSWMAPIKINAFETSDFTNMAATIYIFNAGSTEDAKTTGEGTAGNYSTYPINDAEATDVIPSMQSFSVYATAASPSLKLDYSKLVYDPAVAGLAVQPNFAPRRAKAAAMTSLKLHVAGESGFADELKVYVHEDFDEGFENGWDGHKMYGLDEAPQLYAVTQDGNMAVNCVPDAESMLIGLKAGTKDEQYTMTFEYEDAEPLYMVDTKTNTYTQVMTGNEYTFQTNDLGAHSRFILTHYAPQMPTDLESTSDSSLKGRERGLKFIEGEKMFILMNGVLYDATGRRVKGVRE